MAQTTIDFLQRTLEASTINNVEAAREIPKQDDYVDGLYNQVLRELLTYMISDPSTISYAN
jgi:phosphate transport system protein